MILVCWFICNDIVDQYLDVCNYFEVLSQLLFTCVGRAGVDNDAGSLFIRCRSGIVCVILLEDDVVNMGCEDAVEGLAHVHEDVTVEIVVWVDCFEVACCFEVQCCVDVDWYGWEGFLTCLEFMISWKAVVHCWCGGGVGGRFRMSWRCNR